jgi:SpoU rRNA methylase family enzyme
MARLARLVTLVSALLALAGCASFGARSGGPKGADVSTDEYIATLPADKVQPVWQAQEDLLQAERQAARVAHASALARVRLDQAKASSAMRQAAVDKARKDIELVRAEYEAQLDGVPVSREAPPNVEGAMRRLREAEHGLRVAQWEEEQARAFAELRDRELAYARAYADAAQQTVELKKAEFELAKQVVVAENQPNAVPGVVNPRVARAQAALREAQARYAQAHAGAIERLAAAQVQEKTMARFQGGPPSLAATLGVGRSGAAPLAPAQRQVELEPLPWPGQYATGAPPAAPAAAAPAARSGAGAPAKAKPQ